jgi:hypothetical protein
MSEALDLGPIKARLAATTPGEWLWADEVGTIPYEQAWEHPSGEHITGNDGALGVIGLFIEVPAEGDSFVLEPILYVPDDEVLDALEDWRGDIQVTNLADLDFIANARADIEALIAEVERLRGLG